MRAAAFLYPWDVAGDPEAARRVADLGVQQVTLAAAYHSTRALTPRHPRHRVVTARHAAVLYPHDTERWAGRALRPYTQDWVAGPDPFGEAARALTDAGLEVHSWVVLAHNARLGAEHPSIAVRNAYGDRYPWAPCIARPEVRTYLRDLAAEAAARPGARGTELESCGWYGLTHLHAHDKTGGVPLSGAARYLMSLCFCEVCETGYAELGVAAAEVRGAVVRALEPVWAGADGSGEEAGGGRAGEWRAVEKLLGGELSGLVRRWRDGAARTLQREVVAAVRAAAGDGFRVLLHADPAPHRCGANAGVDPADVLAHADGVVVPCAGDDAARTDALAPFAGVHARAAGRPQAGARPATPDAPPAPVVAANLTVVTAMGGSPGTLAADAAHAAALGAGELRLYHAGLAGNSDLAAVRRGLAAVRSGLAAVRSGAADVRSGAADVPRGPDDVPAAPR
ncbi:hypothetical protein [Streptomyces sp. CB02923]|uniref:hypothetical protein n=1 Tax=Streptomyces sp. CB02923 TaxID=1718985 RepID=UPI000A6BEEE6|nr:hypothetical protein [Streptomyces sp. CB02923]